MQPRAFCFLHVNVNQLEDNFLMEQRTMKYCKNPYFCLVSLMGISLSSVEPKGYLGFTRAPEAKISVSSAGWDSCCCCVCEEWKVEPPLVSSCSASSSVRAERFQQGFDSEGVSALGPSRRHSFLISEADDWFLCADETAEAWKKGGAGLQPCSLVLLPHVSNGGVCFLLVCTEPITTLSTLRSPWKELDTIAIIVIININYYYFRSRFFLPFDIFTAVSLIYYNCCFPFGNLTDPFDFSGVCVNCVRFLFFFFVVFFLAQTRKCF